MLEFFVILSKGGIVLWAVEGTKDLLLPSVNHLIRSVILQERSGGSSMLETGSLMVQYKLDNEFELLFVAAYQKILQLSYVDKFLTDMQRELRDRYRTQLSLHTLQIGRDSLDPTIMADLYARVQRDAEMLTFQQANEPRRMRTYEESKKSSKTVASLILSRPGDKENKKKTTEQLPPTGTAPTNGTTNGNGNGVPELKVLPKGVQRRPGPGKFLTKSPKTAEKEKGKKPRQWEGHGSPKDIHTLEYTTDKPEGEEKTVQVDRSMVSKMTGNIKPLEVQQTVEEEKGKAGGGVMGLFKGLVSGKTLEKDDLIPTLEKLKDHLISKNVAAEVALKLCESLGTKLEGKSLGTFQTVSSTVRSALEESLLALLQPKRQVDVLREALEAKRQGRPFVVTFCGVNGVGKSTNLAKICFWLIENDLRVLVAACDTFRAGAVEQLRTHARSLNALHPPKNGQPFVELYEKGYGKDAAGVASEAIGYARDHRIDVVLVDTAGRMQDNEPLMRALAKLIRVNDPDLVLFVGEALVGNEAVDQLIKFNRALADFSDSGTPRLIDGMVLTKFDTIDDKVGAAVSMVYITGQPIVFVGTGQTYTDLRALDSRAVVQALLK